MGSDALCAFGVFNSPFSASYVGFGLSETPAALSWTPLLSAPAVKASPAGLYAIDAAELSSPNYALNCVLEQLTVITRPRQNLNRLPLIRKTAY